MFYNLHTDELKKWNCFGQHGSQYASFKHTQTQFEKTQHQQSIKIRSCEENLNATTEGTINPPL